MPAQFLRRSVTSVLLLAAFASCVTPFQGIDEARVAARRTPGSRQAIEFASAVHHSVTNGDYQGNRPKLTTDVNDALHTIAAVKQPVRIDLATMLFWRGALLTDVGDGAGSQAAFEKSFAVAPTRSTTDILVATYGALTQHDRVGATCRRAFDAIDDTDYRLGLVDRCRESMNSATAEGGNSWMTPAQHQWVHDATVARIQGMIADEARENQKNREEKHILRIAQQCGDSCRETGLRCQNRCGGDGNCENRCVDISNSCLNRCESQAHDRFGE